jgi:hypothetical protein
VYQAVSIKGIHDPRGLQIVCQEPLMVSSPHLLSSQLLV